MKKNKKIKEKKEFTKSKRILWGIIFLFFCLFLILSFLNRGGILGKLFYKILFSFFGKTIYFLSPLFFLISLALFFSKTEKIILILILNSLFFIFGTSSFLGEGFWGKIFFKIFSNLLGFLSAKIIFFFSFSVPLLVFWEILREKEQKPKISFFKKIIAPKFEILPLEKQKVKIEQLKEKEEKISKPKPKEYRFPPLDLLESEKEKFQPLDLEKNSQIIKKTLEDFGISVQLGPINVGPTVTQYTLKPAEGIRLAKISSLYRELALALASPQIRIEAPIPGKGLVGIEIPNKVRTRVRLRNLISDPEFQKNPSNLFIVLGRDVSGLVQFADLEKMPHLLVAGATGTGKTIFLNTLIISLIYRNSPSQLRFIMIDPKRVEFSYYLDLPHLLKPVLQESKDALSCLSWLVEEMETRFEEFSEKKIRDIFQYNKLAQKQGFSPLPFVVLIVDELADLMVQKGKDLEAKIVKLAQKSRAVGIHLVLATQRPSVDVITGLIKANINTRIAFQVPSHIDSRTILDVSGAEKLLGMGDMLYLSPERVKPKRIQAPFVSTKEIENVVSWVKENYSIEAEDYLQESFDTFLKEQKETDFKWPIDQEDPLFEQAKRVVLQSKKASASLLQRRLKIGYARAARLLDILEEKGIVGPAQGAKPRDVYLKENEDWEIKND